MTPKRTLTLGMAFALAVILLTSCNTVHVHRRPRRGGSVGNGPPAHAKAHGYRRKHVCGHDLIYDTNWGVYVVVGLTDCYYHEGHFYRLRGDVWEISLRADSGWASVSVPSLPPGLRKKAGQRTHAKAKIAVAPKSPGLGAAKTPEAGNGDNGKGKGKGSGKGYARGKGSKK